MSKKLKILIVEDDPVVRLMTFKQLARLGMESATVGTGEEAVDYDRTEIGLIFMDIGLPGIDGINATMRIREKELQEGCKRVPIVALTAHSDRARCILAGMDDFLQKPALLADFKRIIEKWMASSNGSGSS
ncbi:MAG TPA: response regulator [Candidatus Obscuribacterales bacterium]